MKQAAFEFEPQKNRKQPQDREPIDALLTRDPEESLWDRLYWQFRVSPLLAAEISDIGGLPMSNSL